MKIIKPFYLGTLTRPFSMHRQHRLGVAVFVVADYSRNEDHPRLDPDQLLWRDLLPQLDCQGMIDQFIPKPQAEYMVSGFATTEFAKQDNQCAVRVQVGDLEKSLMVSGQRYWLNGRLTEPEPFERMDVTWENAFGGTSFAENTAGKGADTVKVAGILTRLAPNIELPATRMETQQSTIEPASFGPIPLMRPSRFALGGSYSEKWLKKDFPGFFPDLNSAIFNAASPDQRWAKRDCLPEHAPFTIWNMTPGQPYWAGTLPDWKARCFVIKSKLSREDEILQGHDRHAGQTPDRGHAQGPNGCHAPAQGPLLPLGETSAPEQEPTKVPGSESEQEQFIEIPLRATTAWFVPHEKKVILIYHGSLQIDEDDAADIKCIMPALEKPDEPREISWYQRVMQQRRDPEHGAMYAFLDSELVPKDLLNPLELLDMQVTQLARWQKAIVRKDQMIAQRREFIAQSGYDPDQYIPIVMGPERHYSVQDVPELMEAAKALPAQADKVKAERRAEIHTHSLAPELTKAILDNQIKPPPGPPRTIAAQIDDHMLGDLEQMADKYKDVLDAWHDHQPTALAQINEPSVAGVHTRKMTLGEAIDTDEFAKANRQFRERAQEIGKMPEFAALDRLTRMEPLNRKMYLYSVQMQEGVARVSAHRNQQIRTSVQERYAADKNLSMMDLTGADLSGMQLSGADLHGAFMEAVDLSGADLSGCNLSEAVLARATLDGCNLSNANLNSANLSVINANQARFEGASLDSSIIEQSRFFECDFSQASIAQLLLNKIRFEQCSFKDAALLQCIFTECEFTENVMGARMTRTTFVQSQLTRNQYAGAVLDSSHFVKSALQGEVFGYGKFINVAMTYHTTVQDCSFAHSQFKQCNLRGLHLDGQDFTHADMSMTDLSECSMQGSTLSKMTARDTLFVRTDLRHARGEHTNLIQATLTQANLEHANFSKANFFRANLGGARLDETTNLDRAFTTEANLYPLRNLQENDS